MSKPSNIQVKCEQHRQPQDDVTYLLIHVKQIGSSHLVSNKDKR